MGEDRGGHSLDTSLLPCRLQQHKVQRSTKGPRYAKNLSHTHTHTHISNGQSRSSSQRAEDPKSQFLFVHVYVLLLLIDSSCNFVLSYGCGVC